MIMLQNTVSGVPELKLVKTQNDRDVAHGSPPLDYTKYKHLLLAAASILDEDRGPIRPRHSRGIHQTEMVPTFSEDPSTELYANSHDLHSPDDDGDVFYDIDTDPMTVQVNMTNRSNLKTPSTKFGPSMGRDKWYSLSPSERTAWDSLSSDAKAIILGLKTPKPTTKPTTLSHPLRQTKLHDISVQDFLQLVNQHSTHPPDIASSAVSSLTPNPETSHNTETEPSHSDVLLAHATKRFPKKAPPSDLRRLLSSSDEKQLSTSVNFTSQDTINVNGKVYRQVNKHITYHISNMKASQRGSLVDRGANGGLAGADVRIIHRASHPRMVDVSGIDHHELTNLPICTVGGVIASQRGPVIVILHQYAYVGRGSTIHSSGQLEMYKNTVNDKSLKVPGGQQCITTCDGYVHPLDIKNGLPYVSIRPYTDLEWDTLPHVIWTSDEEWDPTVLDHTLTDDEQWYDAISDLQEGILHSPFDTFGNYCYCEADIHTFDAGEELHTSVDDPDILHDDDDNPTTLQDIVDDTIMAHDSHQHIFVQEHRTLRNPRLRNPKPPDYEALRPFFLGAPASVVKHTFDATTQFARTNMGSLMKKHFKSPFPACNVARRNEPVATDTVYSDVPAIDGGQTAAQLFVGRKTLVTDAYGMTSDKQFVNTLEDNIRKRGAMDKLISDSAQVEIGKRVKDILRALVIDDWQSEPHYQHQNFAERRYSTIKPMVNKLLDRTGAPAFCWLLALLYVIFVLNHTAVQSLNWRTPIESLTGSTPDISSLVLFRFWEPVYYKVDDSSFPSESTEKLGRFVGIAEHVGHALTFKVLTDDTLKIIHRSNIRSAADPTSENLRANLDHGEQVPEIIKSKHDGELKEGKTLPTIDPEDLIGRTFLRLPEEDGQRFRVKIIEAIADNQHDLAERKENIKFRCSVDDGRYEEIVSYNDIINHLENDQTDHGVWKFKSITAHQGPLSAGDKSYKGSRWNVLVNWETGESTYEPLNLIAADDPVTCAIYAKENNLLEKEGWKRFKRIAKRQKKLIRLMNQAKLNSFRTKPVYMFGFLVPRNHNQAVEIDEKNGNTKWQDAEKLELSQLAEYNTFEDKGKNGNVPQGYKRIRVHFVYAVKHDGRHKARLVAGGHLTDTPVDSVYSSVVSLRGLRLIMFLGELNGQETWSTDIGNAYLEAKTAERVFIIGGPEFGELEGHVLIIVKALYGLRSSGLRWHERFADSLRDMGFKPSKAEDDIWMRQNGDVYDYIATYVDDLCIVSKEPQVYVKLLENKYKYKLKGTGPITFHLGCDYFRDEHGVLCFAPRKYIDKMMEGYMKMFGNKPKEYDSPLDKGDHPELDESEELDQEDIKKYQSLIGSMQWAVSLGRIDITTAVMTMSSFRVAPRQGHLDRLKRICGYLLKFKSSAIRIRTAEPDFSDLPEQIFDWAKTVYGEVKELIPENIPIPLGKFVTLVTYVDANLFHNMITGRSVTGILHFINKTPFDWYSKKQGTVETATYGSEFVAARTATEQIIDHRLTLRYLGVNIREKTYMFGDNKTVVDSSSRPHARLHKRHTALSFHRVREAIASKILDFYHISGKINPADILSKHWGHKQIWTMLKPLLFHEGDTFDLWEEDEDVSTNQANGE